MTEEELYRKAKKKVRQKKGFYIHFGIYGLIIFMLFYINNFLAFDPFQWWIIPALAWGTGILAHGVGVFGLPWQHVGEDWEERELEKEMRKLERQQGIIHKPDTDITIPEDELELKDFKKLRREWDNQDLV